MVTVYLKFWPSEFKVQSFKQDVSLSETYGKPVVMNTLWKENYLSYRFLCGISTGSFLSIG